MPRGVRIPDLHARLFAAAEAVLLRDGAQALTSRAVTDEAECAKGLLHREFGDFDGFLAALVRNRAEAAREYATVLRGRAGTGTVAGNTIDGLVELISPTATAIVALLIFRDELRARLRAENGPHQMPLLTDVAAAVTEYLEAERDLGRLPAEMDVETVARMLIGSTHLLFADRTTDREEAREELSRMVGTVIG